MPEGCCNYQAPYPWPYMSPVSPAMTKPPKRRHRRESVAKASPHSQREDRTEGGAGAEAGRRVQGPRASPPVVCRERGQLESLRRDTSLIPSEARSFAGGDCSFSSGVQQPSPQRNFIFSTSEFIPVSETDTGKVTSHSKFSPPSP